MPSTDGRSVCLCWAKSKPKGPEKDLHLKDQTKGYPLLRPKTPLFLQITNIPQTFLVSINLMNIFNRALRKSENTFVIGFTNPCSGFYNSPRKIMESRTTLATLTSNLTYSHPWMWQNGEFALKDTTMSQCFPQVGESWCGCECIPDRIPDMPHLRTTL